MANIDHTQLTSDNAEEFDRITKDIKFEKQEHITREPGSLYIRTIWGVPVYELQELSREHPDITFMARHSFESDRYSEIHHVQYKAGTSEFVDAEPNYAYPVQEYVQAQVPCYDELLDEATAIFRRIDITVDDPQKGKRIDWCKAEVTVVVERDGFRMRVKKRLCEIGEIEVFRARKIHSVAWERVDAAKNGVSIDEDGILF